MTPASNTRRRFAIALILVLALAGVIPVATAEADTWTVRKDGSGQFTTINAAKAAATTGDIIEVGPGVYPEEIDFSYAVTLVSTDGAATTILDGENVRRILIFRAGAGSVVDGFTLRRGYHVSSAGALRVQLGATASARNCHFENNHADFDGGAVISRDAGSRLDISDCLFESNTAARYAGAVLIVLDGAGSLDHCIFKNNTGPSNGAIATNTGAVYSVTNCLFVDNSGSAAALYAQDSTPTITGNTFYANSGSATLHISSSNTILERNLIVGNPTGAGIWLSGNVLSRTCNLYWNNDDPDFPEAGEVAADPVFCDAANGVFTISIHSPAAPSESPCGQLMGAFPTACNIEPPPPPPPPVVEPVILTITDVPNDQGNQVRIRWERADYDAPNQEYMITGYAVYRYQGEFAATVKPPLGARTGKKGPAIDGWDYIATVPARGDDIYQYVAPTLCNKPKNGDPCWSVFFVSAMTPYPLVYFDSAPDSGYSEDNLPPGPPSAFLLAMTQSGANLDWQPSPDADVVHYQVYRAEGVDPIPGPSTLIHSTAATDWVDAAGTGLSHYLVSAIDENGNESTAATPGTITPVGNVTPSRFALRQNSPNPFNPSTQIAFDVPAGGGRVTIDIFDVAGRRVRGLLNEQRSAGTWMVQWDGTTDRGSRASSGVYFYRLRAPGFEQTLRMTLVQ